MVTEVWFLELAQKGHTLSWEEVSPSREHQKGSVFCLLIGSLVKGPVQQRHQPVARVLQLQQIPNFIYLLQSLRTQERSQQGPAGCKCTHGSPEQKHQWQGYWWDTLNPNPQERLSHTAVAETASDQELRPSSLNGLCIHA